MINTKKELEKAIKEVCKEWNINAKGLRLKEFVNALIIAIFNDRIKEANELQDILEKLYYAPKMDNLNPVAWKNVHINQAKKEVKQYYLNLLRKTYQSFFKLSCSLVSNFEAEIHKKIEED